MIGKAWFVQVAKRQHRPAYDQLAQYLQRSGRVWLIGPVYAALAKNGSDFELARELFEKARSTYHPLTVTSIDAAFRRASEQR
jgi:hypothetical protein